MGYLKSNNSLLTGLDDRFGPGSHMEFFVYLFYMGAHGFIADRSLAGNAPEVIPLRHYAQDLS